ncbi:hypothetical protein [Nocardia donostiensis]|uniref:Uncharacterized protein n=1 Tax=Nocardia donostiensis TaxID=1538463 RepID=A0A1V2TLR6_9NOCA|nr:hypothetical protein [Nocardia donostiensis]ONM50291.1 hypothetical protein B0T46_04310 [Nocardia donostiensis]OQS15952.1 hypothetical protein B0T36_08405 [Nocardia donostiensis]OQS17484.1 hypothetical protein B0T44_24650 [Nocardia donostiensis]
MSEELDDIGRETAAMMKTMLQIATLVALKTREKGQREAEARVKLTQEKLKEAREMQVREARDAKAKDPRNIELAHMISTPAPEKAPSLAPQRDTSGYRGVSLEKDRFSMSGQLSEMAGAVADSKPAISYDSAERREALAAHLSKIGVAPELAAVRMLAEVGQAKPPIEAVRNRPEYAPSVARSREQELERGLERSR